MDGGRAEREKRGRERESEGLSMTLALKVWVSIVFGVLSSCGS